MSKDKTSKTKAAKTEEVEKAESKAIKLPKGGANFLNLPTDKVSVKKGFNPRKDLGDLTVLKAGLREQGMLSPITVCPTKPGADTYYVIAGERRLTGWKELGKPAVPAVIRDDLQIDSRAAFDLAVSENSSEGRSSLSPLDEAAAFQRMLEEEGGAGNEGAVAKRSGHSITHVRRGLKLLDVPQPVKDRLMSGDLSKNAALATLDIPEEVRARVVKSLPPNAGEGEIRRIANEAKAEVRSEGEKTKTGKDSKHNRPIGQASGQVTIERGRREVRAKIRELGVDCLNCFDWGEDGKGKGKLTDEPTYTVKSHQLAALLWAGGSIPEIDPASKEFGVAFADIKERLDAEMDETPAAAKKESKKETKKEKKAAKAKTGKIEKKPKTEKTEKKAAAKAAEDAADE